MDLLREGRATRCASSRRPSSSPRASTPRCARHPDFVPAGYLLDGAQHFDAGFWGISPVEARLMDPQHRLFLQAAWRPSRAPATRRARGTPPRTAVFASSGIDGYLVHHLEGAPLKDTLSPGDIFLAEVGSEKDYISTRVSYALDLMGPSLAVNSACSSALSAIAMACASLVSRQSDMAVAGAAALTFPGTATCSSRGSSTRSTARCALRRQGARHRLRRRGRRGHPETARRRARRRRQRARHRARAGVTNDGARKAGYAAPGVAGQAAAVSQASTRRRESTSSQVTYVECHATGTLVGDGIELRALTEAVLPPPPIITPP